MGFDLYHWWSSFPHLGCTDEHHNMNVNWCLKKKKQQQHTLFLVIIICCASCTSKCLISISVSQLMPWYHIVKGYNIRCHQSGDSACFYNPHRELAARVSHCIFQMLSPEVVRSSFENVQITLSFGKGWYPDLWCLSESMKSSETIYPISC